MPQKDTISHDGHVVEIHGNKYKVKIITQSACAACHARGVCNPLDQKEKIIDAVSAEKLHLNEKVTVELAEKLGWKALFYGIIIPFVIMITVLFVLSNLFKSELYPALIGLASMVPYYFFIYLLRDKFEKEFIFTAKKVL